MSNKIVQMFLRGATLIMMLIAFFLNSEHENLRAFGQFIKSGVYGGYAIVTLGLLCEVGLQINSDIYIEGALLLGGALLNSLCTAIALTDFHKQYSTETLDMGLLSILCSVIYIADFLLLFFS